LATKLDITAAIQEGIEHVERTFGALTDDQLQVKVHESDGGWTAKEILAHLAGRARGYEMMRNLAAGSPPPGGMDFNHWNRERVAERIANSRDDLLAEFRATHDGLIAYVESLDDAALSTPITFGPQPIPLGDILLRSGGMHSVNHAREVEEALNRGA
jgi:uncharacterized protein (TIGR03083 family)